MGQCRVRNARRVLLALLAVAVPMTFAADAGAYDATYHVKGGSGQAPGITSANHTTFTVGSAGSFTVTSCGYPKPSLSESGALPSGVTFTDDGDGTASLSGTPAAGTGGTYPFTITASNGVGSVATQLFTLTVNNSAAITSPGLTTFVAGTAGSFTIVAAGAPTPSLSQSGALPPGVAFQDNGNGTGTLSGTPAAGSGGVYDFTVTASNGVGPNASQSFALTVDGTPGVQPSAPAVQSTGGVAFAGSVNPEGLPTTAYFEYGIDLSERGPGSSTVPYDETTPVEPVGSDSFSHAVSSSAADLQPNALYHVRLVATNSAGTTVGPDQTFITAASPSAPPPPVLGKAVNVSPVSGHVFILLPPGKSLGVGDRSALAKGQGFVPLTEARQIPTGALQLRHRSRHYLHRRRQVQWHPHPRHPRHGPRRRLRPTQDHLASLWPELPGDGDRFPQIARAGEVAMLGGEASDDRVAVGPVPPQGRRRSRGCRTESRRRECHRCRPRWPRDCARSTRPGW